jgi:actin-like ATPase involved in cell morphogenesis
MAEKCFVELISKTKPSKVFAPVVKICSFEDFKEPWTEIERRALYEALISAGAYQIFLLDELQVF